MQEVKGKRVYVGLSGGVDSAVSAALLKEAGAQVTGVFIKGWYPPGMPCTWAEERRDAMRVAAHLHIPFRTLDASTEYKKEVIDYLLSEYSAGRTPNPDVMCNKEVKFGVFYRYAMAEGADAIATGHYRACEKDQSYFLWAVPKEVLAATIFPVGLMEKSTVRKIAKKFNLPVSDKKDSQGICFLGSVSVLEFLQNEFGTDNPALTYTLGQRFPKAGGKWYVASKDINRGTVELSRSRESSTREVHYDSANWHSNPSNAVVAQLRYRGPFLYGHIESNCFMSDSFLPELSVPGQSIVFYDANLDLVGGGIISA